MDYTAPLSESQRQPGIALEHLLAEIAAFPLATVTAFENPVTIIDPDINDTFKETGSTGLLWREAERFITRICPDLSIDMALAVRDHLWFGSGTQDTKHQGPELYNYLRRLSHEFLELRGDHAVPKFMENDMLYERESRFDTITRRNNTLRWFSFSIPMDLLLGAGACNTCPPSKVEYLSSQMYKNLEDYGFAEPHLHVGASLEFPEFWVAVLNRIGLPSIKDDVFKSPGAEFNEGKLFFPWLIRAALARALLARFLYSFHHPLLSFSDWLYKHAYPEISRNRGRAVLEALRRGLMELNTGRLKPHEGLNINAILASIYRELIHPNLIYHLDDHPEVIHACDPIARLTRYCPGKSPNPEICFVHRSIFYFLNRAKEKKPDLMYTSLFWQVIRMRCLFYRHVTQRPMTPGLVWFLRHYDRLSAGRKNANIKLLVRSAAKTCGMGKGLKSLEVRKSPGDSVSEMLELAHDGIESIRYWNTKRYSSNDFFRRFQYPLQPGLMNYFENPPKQNLEFGWVLHFEKLRGEESLKGLDKPDWKRTNAAPEIDLGFSKNKSGIQNRYAKYYRERKYRALLLGSLLLHFPRALKVIRGIDVCTDELGVPSWVLVPYFRYLTDVGNIASRHLKIRFGEEVPPLRRTVHAGEDHVHLLGGLRRVEEAIRFFKLGPGDRIGHGMALGTSPESWANRTGRVAMRLEDRLFDLAWEWSQYSTHVLTYSSGRLAFIEREITRLSQIIFSETLSPFDIEKLTQHLHDESWLKKAKYPDCDIFFRSTNSESQKYYDEDKEHFRQLDLLKKYLTNPRVFERGHTVHWFSVLPEIETMITLQNHVRRLVGTLGIVVEVNPTSNLLIGNIADLKNHPFWRLDPPTGDVNIPPVPLCIGSDDPLTFATDLRREYALVYESLIDGGLSAREAWDWVDRIRLIGMNSRFTLKLPEVQHDQEVYFRYENRFSVIDQELPRSYWVLGLDKEIEEMP